MRIRGSIVLLFLALLTVLMVGSCAKDEQNQDLSRDKRVVLLEDAMAYLGVCSPEEAVDLWARGLMERSAAMQYAVMDAQLRQHYKEILEQNAPDWVTGLSSPWVSGYSVIEYSETAQGLRLYSLYISTETSAGPAQSYLAVLALEQDGSYWRIAALSLDEELGAYTGGFTD